MDFFDFLNLMGGLSLFLFGMNSMGDALERRAGGGLRTLLAKLTKNKFTGLLTGLVVTAIIQSSSATTVMVVGFVNSGIMTLNQSIGVIMGANVGTTVTAWILSLAGITSDNFFIRLLNPSSFTPVLALIGILMYSLGKTSKKRDTGLIFIGFAILIFGMNFMSSSVAGLRDEPAFRNMFLAFTNPFLGILAGALLTAIIQSSSASVGILQALSMTGQVTYGAAVPIIMGQNIGTCVTALIASVGTNKNARRAALIHLSFNIIGTLVCISIFSIFTYQFHPPFLLNSATASGIAFSHSLFNIVCTLIMLPFANALEKLVYKIIPEGIEEKEEEVMVLDERLFATPKLALVQCKDYMGDMLDLAVEASTKAMKAITSYNKDYAKIIRKNEEKTDKMEDALGTYLIRLSANPIGDRASAAAGQYMKFIGDFERIGDHAVNLLESAEEIKMEKIFFSDTAKTDYNVISRAVMEIMSLIKKAFNENDLEAARDVEALEQVIDELKESLRTKHILRLQKGSCSMEADFVWSDILTNLERISDHCSNVSNAILDQNELNMNTHKTARHFRETSEDFRTSYIFYRDKYRSLMK
jgi:phosphate:Na+ symporter